MTDVRGDPGGGPPEPELTEPGAGRRLPSLVWLVPLLALAISAFLVWRNYAERGPLIQIAYENASGVAAGETELRYRDVTVGQVESVGFTDGLGRVLVSVRVTDEVAPFIDADARFWVVRPEVTTRGVTGLQTVLSGVYLEGAWDLDPGGFERTHVGLDQPPLFEPGREGLSLVLTTEAGEGLNAEAPVLYKGIEVGRVARARLSEDGLTALADAVIYAPHDALVSSATRFWDASGFTFSLGTEGAELDFASVATLVSGGVSFDTVVSGGEPVPDGAVFRVFPDEDAARAAMVLSPGDESVLLTAVFSGEVGGLSAGAPVELRGLTIGDVVSVAGVVDPERFGDDDVRLLATIEIQPSRLGLEPGDAPLAFLRSRVADGLRARLASASFLTNALKVELVDAPDAPEAVLDESAEPFPVLPTVESDLPDVAASATGLFERVSSLPIEELLLSTTAFLDGAARLANSPDLQAAPEDLRAILSDVRAITSSPGAQALPERVDAATRDLAAASAEAQAILSELREQGGAERLLATVDRAGVAAEAVGAAAETAPALLTGLTGLVADVRRPLPQIVERAAGVLAGAEGIVASEAAQGLPARVSLALGEFGAILTEFRQQEILTAFAEAAVAAEEAADATEETALEFAAASEGLPALIAELRGVAVDVRALPIEAAVAELTDLLASIDAVAEQEATQRLPGELAAVAADLDALLTQLNEAQAAQSLAAALDAARAAALDLAAAAEGVPEVVSNVAALTATARDLPLEPLAAQATALLASVEAVIGQESAQALPAALGAALGEVQATLSELRAGGTVENVNATLASARAAAEGVAGAAGSLPDVVGRVNALIGQAQSTLASYGGDSELSREARTALRDIQQAADAVASLARAIERRPNSLLLGR